MPLDQTAFSAATAGKVPRTLLGHEILRVLGKGTGCTVYAARAIGEQTPVALKHVVCRNSQDHRLVEQLETEMEVGRQLQGAGLRRSLNLLVNRTWLRQPREAALTMELIDGICMDQRPVQGPAEIIRCFAQLADSLASLHALGYVHCDISPANILVTAEGQPVLIDFGQACRVTTRKPRIQGTPDFISPEQVLCDAITFRTDVFGFGATLYWGLCGRPVPTLYTCGERKSMLSEQSILSPAKIDPSIPEPLSNFVMECVHTRPARRPADMKEVLQRLETLRYAMGHRE